MFSTSSNAASLLLAIAIASAPSHVSGAGADADAPAPGLRGAPTDGQGPTVVNAIAVRSLLLESETRRIDVVCLGDSNQLFSGSGWQDGLTVALGELYPMYASPLLGAGDNNAIGLALSVMAGATLAPTGAPTELLDFSDPASGVDATPYGFLPTGMTGTAGSELGMRLVVGNSNWPKNNFNADSNLRFHFDYGTFASAPGAVFQPQVLQPGSASVLHPPINPETGAFEIMQLFIDLPAAIRNANTIRFRWFSASAPDAVGPVYTLYMRAEDLDQPIGQSVSTLYGVGGASARDCALALQSAPEPQLRLFFERIRELQPSPKKILIRIAFGANDLTDSEPSIGPDGPFPPDTDAAVADNTREIIRQINEVWTLAGWDPNELVFLLIAPHRRLGAEQPGYGFRQAIADVALDAPNLAFVNHYRIASRDLMLNSGWYDLPTGVHLSASGYESMCRLEIEVLRGALPSDLNGDCVVDTADLGLLISVFGSNDPVGDINGDDVVDTADLGLLINRFGAMCGAP